MSNALLRNLEAIGTGVVSNLATIGLIAALGLTGGLVFFAALVVEDAPVVSSIAIALIIVAAAEWCALGILWLRDRSTRPRVIFSANRNDRDYIRMVKDAGQRVRVVWNTGGGLRRAHRLEELLPYISSIILPYPDRDLNPALIDLAIAAEIKHSTDPPERLEAAIEEVRTAIEEVTTEIQDYNAHARRIGEPTIELWWRKGNMGNLITLSEDWVFVEVFEPGVRASYRPGIQIFKTGAPDEPYELIDRAYKYMLAESEDALAIRSRSE